MGKLGSEPLNDPRAETFCRLILSGERVLDAYIQAGFVGHRQNAYRKKGEPGVKARLDYMQAKAMKAAVAPAIEQAKTALKRELTKQFVLEGLIKNVAIALGEQLMPNGKATWNGMSANRALELLGKELGMFNEKTPADPNEKKVVKPIADVNDHAAIEFLKRYMPDGGRAPG